MKLRTLGALLASATLALAACERTSDVPALQQEANGVVAVYAPRFDGLHRRAEALMKRGRTLTGNVEGVAEASGKLMAANRRLGELRQQLQQGPSTIANAAKAGYPEIARTLETLRSDLHNGETEITAQLQTVESWMERAERPTVGIADAPVNPAGASAPTSNRNDNPSEPLGATQGPPGPGAEPSAQGGSITTPAH